MSSWLLAALAVPQSTQPSATATLALGSGGDLDTANVTGHHMVSEMAHTPDISRDNPDIHCSQAPFIGGGVIHKNSCAKCGDGFNCCGVGGAWAGKCDVPLQQRSWEDGYCACKGARDAFWEAEAPKMHANGSYKLTRWSSPDVLNHLFKQGKPSNDLESAGLMVHCFDDTEDFAEPWTPCKSGFCTKSSRWWSGSIINQHLRTVFGDSGLIMSPSKVELLCSYDQDAGTLYGGCAGKGKEYFGPADTEGMMAQHMGRGGSGYNEVVIDSAKFLADLPMSVAGVVFGLKSGAGGKTFEKIRAVRTYVMMLDRYNLSEANFPLLRANYDVMDFGGEARVKGPAFVDESLKARDYLKKHPYTPALDKWNREHPYLRGHPDLTHEWMRKQNELEQAMVEKTRAREQRQKVRRRTATKSPLRTESEHGSEAHHSGDDLEHHLDHNAEPRKDDEVDGLRPAPKSKPLTKDWRPWNQQGEGEAAADAKLADDSKPPKGTVNDWEWRNRNVPCKGLPCKDEESQESDH